MIRILLLLNLLLNLVLVVSLVYRRLRFVVWNRSHSKDMNRSAVVVTPKKRTASGIL